MSLTHKFSGLVSLFVVLFGVIFAIIPAAVVYHAANGEWKGVPPELVTDSLYYYAQIHEVFDGHFQAGNPYIYELRDSASPAFFIPVDIAAIPLFFGFSLSGAIIFNLILWNSIFLLLVYLLLRELTVPRSWSLIATLPIFLSAYMFMIRPVALQIVFPVFLFFLLALLSWLKLRTRRSAVVLMIAVGITPYAYTYLAQIVFFTMALLALRALIQREWSLFRELCAVGFGAIIVALPFILCIFLPQMFEPAYAESLARIGLVHTRIPASEAFFYGRWVLLGILLVVLLLQKQLFPQSISREVRATLLFFVATGLGLGITAASNVITGTELQLAIHVGRFIILWTAILASYALYALVSDRSFFKTFKDSWLRKGVVVFCLAITLFGLVRNIPRSLAFLDPMYTSDVALVQTYKAPMDWLHANAPRESVIWSNDSIARYVPILTSNYTLFAPPAVLQIDSDSNVRMRYLASRFATSTIETLSNDLGVYAGTGKGKEQPLAENRRVEWCSKYHFLIPSKTCGTTITGAALAGEEYFRGVQNEAEIIQQNRTRFLKLFHVRYLVLDKRTDPTIGAIGVSGNLVFENDDFVIYDLFR